MTLFVGDPSGVGIKRARGSWPQLGRSSNFQDSTVGVGRRKTEPSIAKDWADEDAGHHYRQC